ncbi:MAG: RIP metalloprotease RseP [Verrucomicrobiales bacterium]|nr:RIP metalloprotease RseP [Verrucomicrobiales bacterium]
MDIILNFLRVIGVIFMVVMTFNLLIVVHEWGHFLAARWRGLQVDRFQIWFGKPLWKKTVNGVQYGLGSIPAGGFVALPQMAPMESIEGQNVGEDGEAEEPRDLPPITPLDKIIVAFAGPLFSFLLAVCFAVAVHFVGKPVNEASSTTVVGIVGKGMPADKAGMKVGDKILKIDGKKVSNFTGMINSVQWNIASSTSNPIIVEVDRPSVGQKIIEITMPTAEEKAKKKTSWLKSILGRPELRKIGVGPRTTPVIMSVVDPGPAAEAGIQAGDIAIKINGQEVHSISEVFDYEKANLGKALTYTILRGKEKKELELTVQPRLPILPKVEEVAAAETEGEKTEKKEIQEPQPSMGILWDLAGVRGMSYPGIGEQIGNSLSMMKNTLGAIVTPKSEVSVSHLSGPVGIMNLYYNLFNMENGWRLVLWFSVIMNINLAVLNMLPFPVLDGGHITMAFFEWVSRKPMKFRVLEMVQTAFVILLLGFMVFVSIKDVKNVSDQATRKEGVELRFAPKDGAAPVGEAK